MLTTVRRGRATNRTIDNTTDDAGLSCALAVDGQGRFHVAYTVKDVGVRYAVRVDGTWEHSNVLIAEDTDEYIALGVEADGTPHILFQSGHDLMHATF